MNPLVEIRPIGATYETLFVAYDWFGIMLGKTEEVLARGYAVLKALRKEALKREGKMYVVNDVGAWIAFSNAVATLVLGDGYAMPASLELRPRPLPERRWRE